MEIIYFILDIQFYIWFVRYQSYATKIKSLFINYLNIFLAIFCFHFLENKYFFWNAIFSMIFEFKLATVGSIQAFKTIMKQLDIELINN